MNVPVPKSSGRISLPKSTPGTAKTLKKNQVSQFQNLEIGA
jgi:hypothetical protein